MNVKNFQHRAWHAMNRRVRLDASYQGLEVRVSREEFRAWCAQHGQEIEALYAAGKTPSIDRIDPDGHYELGNMRIRERWENVRDHRPRPSCPVIGTRGRARALFEGITQAAKFVRGASSNIQAACAGRIKSAYGWKWEYFKGVINDDEVREARAGRGRIG